MIEELSRLLLNRDIDRRTFIARMLQAGVSVGGASTIANALAGPAGESAAEASRILRDVSGGEAVAEFMLDWKIPYLFGLAGSEETGFLDALVDRPALQYATCLHENAAMAMADGYARSTGETTVVQLHSVAGTAYALGQLVGSYKDRIPVVVTAGRQSTNIRGHGAFLEAVNLHEMPRDYTQWTWDVMSVGTIPEVMRRAFLLAETPPGGPSFVTFSKDLFEQRIAECEIIPRSRSRVDSEVAPDPDRVKQIADRLLAAEMPCLFVGNECVRNEISAEVAGIAEATGAIVLNSVKIPIVFPNTHPNFVGEVQVDAPELLPRIDCFWSLGGSMFKLFNLPPEPLISRDATVMHTSMVESDVGRNYPVDVATVSSLKTTSRLVLEELQRRDSSTSAIRERQRWISDYTARQRAGYQEQAKVKWNDEPISSERLIVELDGIIGEEADIFGEMITSDSFPRHYLRFDHTRPVEKRRRYFYTTSGVLGWGVAAAIGGKIGNPDKEVWCLTGDGSFNFGCQALWSAARYEVPVGIVIFNNGQYQANRRNQNLYKGRMYQTGKYIGVNLGHPDIDHVALAKAYGVEAEKIVDPKNIRGALQRCRRAINDGRPYVVDVRIATRYKGAESDWYDFFSIARGIPRQT